MGLDNGILIKSHIEEAKEFYPTNYVYKSDNSIEVCYWRKCWGIRNEIINKFHFPQDCGSYKLDKEDISVIIKIILKFCNSEYYKENADSIWEYDEMINNLTTQIVNLKLLTKIWDKYPDLEVEFYDSY